MLNYGVKWLCGWVGGWLDKCTKFKTIQKAVRFKNIVDARDAFYCEASAACMLNEEDEQQILSAVNLQCPLPLSFSPLAGPSWRRLHKTGRRNNAIPVSKRAVTCILTNMLGFVCYTTSAWVTQSKFLTRIFQFSFRIRLRTGLRENRSPIPGDNKGFSTRNRTKTILGPNNSSIEKLASYISWSMRLRLGDVHSAPPNMEGVQWYVVTFPQGLHSAVHN